MKVLVLTWEFPPRKVGGIAPHCAELYPELVKCGHEVHLVTAPPEVEVPAKETIDGVHVYRVGVGESRDLFEWIAKLNDSLGADGGRLIEGIGGFDLIHAHDWVVGDAAMALKSIFKLPLVVTVHATEYGRHQGRIGNGDSQYVHSKELSLVAAADWTIVCSEFMRNEVVGVLRAPMPAVSVIYNGIATRRQPTRDGGDGRDFRRRYARDDEKIVYYVGRMTPEKGMSVFVEAIPHILAQLDVPVKFFFIGGGKTVDLQWRVKELGVADRCVFTGFMADDDLAQFRTIADCAVCPSLYEPFGIVALESFAARVPVVVADAGGLPEVVTDGVTGRVFRRNDALALAAAVVDLLADPIAATVLTDNAYADLVARFDWSQLADRTQLVYTEVLTRSSR
jgi:glycosyltransferase involved in cell wall biosynthesis